MRSLFVLAALCLCVSAQEFRATLAGRITDAAGAAVADAKVEVRDAGTGAVVNTISGSDGSYSVSYLTPGNYVITVEKPGFRKSIRDGVKLEVAEHATVDIQLAIGEVSQSVTVTADSAILETESADRGLTVESNRVLNTPLAGTQSLRPGLGGARRHRERRRAAPAPLRYCRLVQHHRERRAPQHERSAGGRRHQPL